MPTDRWRQTETIFTEALEQPSALRGPFVAGRCGADSGLRDEVTSLLSAADRSRDFLEGPALDAFARQVSREGWSVSAGDRIAAYAIVERIGAGGMGEVWRARDDRLERDVAIKLLLPHASDAAGRVRAFEREARAAGALNHPNVVTLYDVGDHDGAPYMVTECLDGGSLRARLSRGPLGIDAALEIALSVARGLGAAHARGIVHRDLKPENIFLATDGRVKILDFGLASLRGTRPESGRPIVTDAADVSSQSDAAARTLDGGTAGYMAPEQMGGGLVDSRADVFALGAVLYEMLTGERPFRGGSAAEVLEVVLTREPRDPSDLNPRVSRALSQVVRRCLAKSPADRFASVSEVVAPLESIARERTPAARLALRALMRRPAVVATVVLVVLAAGAGVWQWRTVVARSRWAHAAAPEIRQLTSHGSYAAAFLLARRTLDVLPEDPQLRELWLDASGLVDVTTSPAGADVALASYREPGSEWLPLGRTPLTRVRIPRGTSRLRLTSPGFETVEASLTPGPARRFELHPRASTPPGMVRVSGGRDPVRFGSIGDIESFWIDRLEVTNRQFKAFIDRNGYTDRRYWREPFVDGARMLPWEEAIARFRDRSGSPGPSTWSGGTYPAGQADFPVGGVSWYEAAAYAGFAGKRLPTMYHWYLAAGLGRFADILAVSNFSGKGPAPAGQYAGLGPFGTLDMAGNVKEWCWNESGHDRFVLGGAWNEPRYMYADGDARSPFARSAEYGLRLAQYDRPLAPAVTAAVQVEGFNPDALDRPVSDEMFEVFRRLYAYDRTPLNAVIESTEPGASWVKITVGFDAAYGGERMRAHLFLPKNAAPPYQTVVFFPAGDAFQLASSRDMALGTVVPIIESGRALMYPVYKGTYERSGAPPAGASGERELWIAWSRDFGRALDYLETRPDIDRDRFAFYGLSSGGDAGILLTALEPRLKASVLQATGLWTAAAPEMEPRNFAPRVHVPTLLLTGRYDFVMPYESSQRPLFEQLGVAPQHKFHQRFETGHALSSADVREAILRWLESYLGPVRRRQ